MNYFARSSETGALCPADGPDKDAERVLLLTLEEFLKLSDPLPHRRILRQSMSPVLYCKIEAFRDGMLGTMRVPGETAGTRAPLCFGFYLRGNRLYLIAEPGVLDGLLGQLCAGDHGSGSLREVLLRLFDLLISDDVVQLLALEEQLSDAEEALLNRRPSHFYKTILAYRKQLSAIHAYYEQLADLGDLMQADLGRQLSEEERDGWRLFASRAQRLHGQVERLREYLLQLREFYQTQIDVQQNRIMALLTVVTTIFMPLTLIVGWYGMNFPNMLAYRWKYGYPAVVLLSVTITVVEIVYFKKKKML